MIIVIAVIMGIVGVLVGGVINVLADDLPARRNPRVPHYPDDTLRPIGAWLGLGAFLTGQRAPSQAPNKPKGKSGEVKNQLSWRHPVVEVCMGVSFAAMVLAFDDEPNLWAWLVYAAIMMLITVIDVEHRLILFVVIIPSCVFALLVAIIAPETGRDLGTYLSGALMGFGLFFVIFLGGILFTLVSRHEGVAFGFGDVMLATLGGLMIGWKAFIVATWITVFAGAAGSILYMIARMIMRRYQRFTPLPYGPYLVLGIMSVLLFGDQLRDILFNSAY